MEGVFYICIMPSRAHSHIAFAMLSHFPKGTELHFSPQSWGSVGFLNEVLIFSAAVKQRINKHISLNVENQINLKRVCDLLRATQSVPCVLSNVWCYMVRIHIIVVRFLMNLHTETITLNLLKVSVQVLWGVVLFLTLPVTLNELLYFKIQCRVPIIFHKVLLVQRNISVYYFGTLGL